MSLPPSPKWKKYRAGFVKFWCLRSEAPGGPQTTAWLCQPKPKARWDVGCCRQARLQPDEWGSKRMGSQEKPNYLRDFIGLSRLRTPSLQVKTSFQVSGAFPGKRSPTRICVFPRKMSCAQLYYHCRRPFVEVWVRALIGDCDPVCLRP
jgi:hypothetical protein